MRLELPMRDHNERNLKSVFLTTGNLLAYPSESLQEQSTLFEELIAQTSRATSERLKSFTQWFLSQDLLELQKHYVEIFDQKRSSCLYLTFFLNGDTRQRGMALWRFGQAYREFGFEVDNGELPDFLPAVLQFAATIDFESGLSLLQSHNRALVVLLNSLQKHESPYALLLQILLDNLPPLSPEDLQAAEALINAGPPTEMVGLEGYGGPVSISIGVRP